MAILSLEVKDLYLDKFLDAEGMNRDQFDALPDDKKAEMEQKFLDFAAPLMRDHMDKYIKDEQAKDPSKTEDDLMLEYSQLPMDNEANKDLKETLDKSIEELAENNTVNVDQDLNEEQIAAWKLRYIEEFQKGCEAKEYELEHSDPKEEGLDLLVFEKGADKENDEPIVRAYHTDENNAALSIQSQDGADFAMERYKNLGVKNINLTMKKSDGTEMDPEYKAWVMISCMKNDLNCKFDGKKPNFEELGITDEKIIEDYNKALEEYNKRHNIKDKEDEKEGDDKGDDKTAVIAELRKRARGFVDEEVKEGDTRSFKERLAEKEAEISKRQIEVAKERGDLLNKGGAAIKGRADDDEDKKLYLDLEKRITELKEQGEKQTFYTKEQSEALQKAADEHRIMTLSALSEEDKAKFAGLEQESDDIQRRKQGKDIRTAQTAFIEKGAAALTGDEKTKYEETVTEMNLANETLNNYHDIKYGSVDKDGKKIEGRPLTEDEQKNYDEAKKTSYDKNNERKTIALGGLSADDKKQYDNNTKKLEARSSAFSKYQEEAKSR